ncbi:MAG: tripartite tricarboxylate transporter substrate-binding protein [Acidobacteriota bacterium]|nr:tripartite tricarboxylate transporter substrate-binding protein [Acidobacteriota bacterium]
MIFRGALAILLSIPLILSASTPLTIVAPAAPGGGWDQTARAMQRVLAAIEPGASVQVDNVPGAAGTIGLARFVQSERGNPNALLVTGLVMVSGVITSHSPVSLADATPIARLTGETEVIVVPASSSYRSMQALADAFKADPGAIAWGGGSAGGTDDLLVRLMAEQLGLPASRVNYIAFAGGGAALAAVLGGQVTAAVSGYGEFAGQIAAGELRTLAISAAARIPGIDAPTLRESGIALDLANWRAVVAPPGLSDAERDALTDRVARMARSDPWQKTLEQTGWEDTFLAGADFRQFLLAEQARIEAVLHRLAASDTAPSRRMTMSVVPMTLPITVTSLFAVVLIVFLIQRRSAPRPEPGARRPEPGVVILGAALLIQPLLFTAVGFVASSTLLFTVGSHALRGRGWRAGDSLKDIAIGLVFSSLLFLVFSRGLGVSLP